MTRDSKVDPAHYRALKPEPIEVMEGWGLNYRLACVLKYISRAGRKEGADAITDLKKARRYLIREINALEGRASWDYSE